MAPSSNILRFMNDPAGMIDIEIRESRESGRRSDPRTPTRGAAAETR